VIDVKCQRKEQLEEQTSHLVLISTKKDKCESLTVPTNGQIRGHGRVQALHNTRRAYNATSELVGTQGAKVRIYDANRTFLYLSLTANTANIT